MGRVARAKSDERQNAPPVSQPFAMRTIRPNAENERDICLLLVAAALIPIATESRKN